MLELDDIVAGYRHHRVLEGLSLEVGPGCTVVVGPNGAGKTTLFRVGAGILEPMGGTVSIRGANPFGEPDIKREIGYLPHNPSLIPNLTVKNNLRFWGRVLQLDGEYVQERIHSLAASLGFDDLLSNDGDELSRGQAQRVAIARGLLPEPSLLFLDEPTTGLDPSVTTTLLDLLQDLAASDRALVYATHNLHEANELADDIVLLHDGNVAASGARNEITAQYQGSRTVTVQLESDHKRSRLQELDYEYVRHGDRFRFEIGPQTTVMDVIATLDERGIDVVDVETDENPLEKLYQTVGHTENDE